MKRNEINGKYRAYRTLYGEKPRYALATVRFRDGAEERRTVKLSLDPDADMLAVHYVTLGVANPVAYAALRMQTVAIQFPPEHPGDRRLLAYAVAAGAVLGLGPLLFSTPAVGNWYFGVYQNVPPRILGTARLAVGIYSFICMIHAVRGRIEGLAAKRRRPSAVMAGQMAYTLALFVTLAILLPLGVPGWVMAISAIFVAPVAATAAIYAALALGGRGTKEGGQPQP